LVTQAGSKIGLKLKVQAQENKPVAYLPGCSAAINIGMNAMKRTLIIFSLMALASYSNLSGSTAMEQGVEQVNSSMYKVTAAGAKATPEDMEKLTNTATSKAKAFCAKNKRMVEINTITRLEADMGRPASSTLLFWCNKPN
jgi:hypothetical protein